MKFENALSIKSAVLWLPQEREAANTTQMSAADIERLGVSELPVSRLAAPDLAVRAARGALERANWDPGDVGCLMHAWLYFQGHDFWSPAHYIAAQLGAVHALPFGIQQMSNGGAMGLQLGAIHLMADPTLRSVIVTTADRFCLPGFDRWGGDYDVAYGDGGAAVLLGRQDGQSDDLHLLALATLAVPELEGMFRGGDDFAVVPLGHACPIDIRRPKKAFLESDGMTKLRQLGPAKVREVIARSLCDAGLDSHDPKIRYIALPRLGGRTIKEMYIPAIAEVLKAEPLHLGDRTGHLGAGDFLANIADIIGLGLLGPGEIALVIGGGGGFTLSCAVLRAPEQARTRAG